MHFYQACNPLGFILQYLGWLGELSNSSFGMLLNFCSSGDGGVHVTDCSTSQTIGTLRGHTGNVMAVYAGEGDIIATGSTDNTLRLWDLRSHRCIDVVLVGDSSPASVALNGSGSCLASGNFMKFSFLQ